MRIFISQRDCEGVAQLGEQRLYMPRVAGSIPVPLTEEMRGLHLKATCTVDG